MNGRYKRLAHNTFLVFIGNASSKLIGILMLPLYTKWLSVSDYGIADIISVYAVLLGSLLTCCMYESLLVFPKNATKEIKKSSFSTGIFFILFSLAVSALLFKLISDICCFYGIVNSFTNYIWLVYLMFSTDVIFRGIQCFCRSIDKLVPYSASGVVLTIFITIFAFLLIPKYGVIGFVAGKVFANIIAAVYAFISSKSIHYLSITNVSWGQLKPMLKYSIPLIPNSIMWWIVSAINRPILESYVGYEGIGLYAVANKFPGVLAMVHSVFMISWQLSVIEEFGKKDYSEFYNRIIRVVTMLSSVMVIIIALCSKIIVSVFVDSKFYDAWQYIPVLTFGILFSNLAGLVGCNFSASRESKYYFYSSFWSALMAVVMNILLIPICGVWGAVFASFISFFVGAFSRLLFSWKYVQLTGISKYILIFVLDVLFLLLIIYQITSFIIFVTFVLLLSIHAYLLKEDIGSIKYVAIKKWESLSGR